MVTIFLFGLALGGCIGAIGMWLYLMQQNAGRPIDWRGMALAAAVTMVVLGALLSSKP